MATNYTLSEAAKIAAEKTDGEAIFNLGRRYPFLMALLNTVIAKAGQDAVDLLSFMPEKLSANKVNMAMKAAMLGDGNGEDDEDGEDTSAAADKKAKAAERRKARRAAKKTSAPAEADEDEESDNPYEGMNAMELFKLCKERGIAAKPKRSVKFYVDLLTKADAEDGDDGDDWDDGDDEEEKAPAKKTTAKKAPAKKAPAKKTTAKKAEPADDEDDDEDWDI